MILFHKTVSIYFDTNPALQVLRRRLIADTPGGRTPSHPAGPTRATYQRYGTCRPAVAQAVEAPFLRLSFPFSSFPLFYV